MLQDFQDALRTSLRLPGRIDQPGKLLDRSSKHEQVGIESHQLTDGHAALQHQRAADHQDQNGAQRDEQGGRGHDPRPFVVDLEAGFPVGAVDLVELGGFVRLTGEGAHHLDPRHVFLQAGGQVAERIVGVIEEAGDAIAEIDRHHHHRDERQQAYQRHDGVPSDQDGHHTGGNDRQLNDIDYALPGEGLDGAHVLDATVDQLSGRGVVVIGEGQVLDAVVHAVAQVVTHVSGNPLGEVALDKVQGGGQEADAEQEQSRMDQESGRAGFEAVVDHALDDQRHDQRQTGGREQEGQVEGELAEIRVEEGTQTKKIFHGGQGTGRKNRCARQTGLSSAERSSPIENQREIYFTPASTCQNYSCAVGCT